MCWTEAGIANTDFGVIEWNHRRTLVGRDPEDHPFPTPQLWLVSLVVCFMLSQTLFSVSLTRRGWFLWKGAWRRQQFGSVLSVCLVGCLLQWMVWFYDLWWFFDLSRRCPIPAGASHPHILFLWDQLQSSSSWRKLSEGRTWGWNEIETVIKEKLMEIIKQEEEEEEEAVVSLGRGGRKSWALLQPCPCKPCRVQWVSAIPRAASSCFMVVLKGFTVPKAPRNCCMSAFRFEMHLQRFVSSWINGKPFFMLLPPPGELGSYVFGVGWSSPLLQLMFLLPVSVLRRMQVMFICSGLCLSLPQQPAVMLLAVGAIEGLWVMAIIPPLRCTQVYSQQFDLQPSVLQEFVFLFFYWIMALSQAGEWLSRCLLLLT